MSNQVPGFSEAESEGGGLRIARFRCDVTPPPGHPLCGGYEVGAAFCDDGVDRILTEGIRDLLGSAAPT